MQFHKNGTSSRIVFVRLIFFDKIVNKKGFLKIINMYGLKIKKKPHEILGKNIIFNAISQKNDPIVHNICPCRVMTILGYLNFEFSLDLL